MQSGAIKHAASQCEIIKQEKKIDKSTQYELPNSDQLSEESKDRKTEFEDEKTIDGTEENTDINAQNGTDDGNDENEFSISDG